MIGTGSIASARFLDQYAIQFNGTNQYAYKAAPSFQANTAGAFSFWYRPTSVRASDGIYALIALGNASGAANNATFTIGLRRAAGPGVPNSIEVFTRRTNGGAFSATAASGLTLTAGALYHVVVQGNGTAWDIRVNDTTPTTRNWQTGDGVNPGWWLGNITLSTPRLSIGARVFNSTVDNYAPCELNEVYYVNRLLTNTEITGLYKGGVTGNPLRIVPQADMKLILRCGDSQDDATTMYDRSGLGNNFTLVNSPSYVTP